MKDNEELVVNFSQLQLSIYKVSQKYWVFRQMIHSPLGNRLVFDGLIFECVQQARNDFDYDTDSGMETASVFRIHDPAEPFTFAYVKLTGVYQSYDGLNLSHWDFVVPKEVTKVEYISGE